MKQIKKNDLAMVDQFFPFYCILGNNVHIQGGSSLLWDNGLVLGHLFYIVLINADWSVSRQKV